jgi:hypothetical protein
MTTKLDKPIVRELALEYDGRRILLEILPGDPNKGELEAFEFRLKGTSAAKHVRRVTVRQVVESLGWPIKVKIPKAQRPTGLLPGLGEIDLDQLEQDLDRIIKPAGEEP